MFCCAQTLHTVLSLAQLQAYASETQFVLQIAKLPLLPYLLHFPHVVTLLRHRRCLFASLRPSPPLFLSVSLCIILWYGRHATRKPSCGQAGHLRNRDEV